MALNTSESAEGNRIWVKVFKNGPSKICGRQPLNSVIWCTHLYQVIKQVLMRWGESV